MLYIAQEMWIFAKIRDMLETVYLNNLIPWVIIYYCFYSFVCPINREIGCNTLEMSMEVELAWDAMKNLSKGPELTLVSGKSFETAKISCGKSAK